MLKLLGSASRCSFLYTAKQQQKQEINKFTNMPRCALRRLSTFVFSEVTVVRYLLLPWSTPLL
jgi:hypothetical protein